MDVSSMNLQVMVPRATETSQVQHNLNQQVNIQQDFEAIRQKADDALKQKQVRAKSEAEDGKIKEDADHKGQGGSYSSGRRKHAGSDDSEKPESEAAMAVDTFRGHHIDIKL